jgi:hypothetical protein
MGESGGKVSRLVTEIYFEKEDLNRWKPIISKDALFALFSLL